MNKTICAICGKQLERDSEMDDMLSAIGMTDKLETDTPLCHEHNTPENYNKAWGINRDYGTTNYNGEAYTVTCEAWVDNYKNGVRYYAKAEKDGKKYLIAWDTTEKWNDIENCPDCIDIKENSDYETCVFHDNNENACDWDNADNVEEID